MTERPILFSPPMMRAILAGKKTQTRRIVKDVWGGIVPSDRDIVLGSYPNGSQGWFAQWPHQHGIQRAVHPVGVAGDRLWVKEGWRPQVVHSHGSGECDCGDVSVTYLADKAEIFFPDDAGQIPDGWTMPKAAAKGGVTALYMPRWASRLTLAITDVRVQHLQEISDADVRTEGIERHVPDAEEAKIIGPGEYFTDPDGDALEGWTAQGKFRRLWDSLNGKRAPWKSNPWVWAISFQVVK